MEFSEPGKLRPGVEGSNVPRLVPPSEGPGNRAFLLAGKTRAVRWRAKVDGEWRGVRRYDRPPIKRPFTTTRYDTMGR